MFDFDPTPKKYSEVASQNRFVARAREDWQPDYPRTWWARYGFWWLVHNVPAHLLIAFLPFKQSFVFHDWTSMRLHNESKLS